MRLDVVEKATGEVVESIDLTGETPSGVRQIRAGLSAQMNHEDYRIVEVEEGDG